MTDPRMDEAARLLARARRVVALTGAGISAESGVPTFRGRDGLWKTYRAEELATPEAFERDPSLVWEWYDWRRGLIAKVEPNPGHQVLARWERVFEINLEPTSLTSSADVFLAGPAGEVLPALEARLAGKRHA